MIPKFSFFVFALFPVSGVLAFGYSQLLGSVFFPCAGEDVHLVELYAALLNLSFERHSSTFLRSDHKAQYQ